MLIKGGSPAAPCLAGVTPVAPNGQSEAYPPALVIGTGITALGVVRALGRAGVPRFVVSPPPGPACWSRWYRRPPGGEYLHDPERLGEYLDRLPLERGVPIPCSDDAALAIARLPAHLKARFPSSSAPAQVIAKLVDKGAFLDLLREHEVPHPRTVVLEGAPESPDQWDMDLDRAFVKPRNSQEFAQRFGVKAIRPEGSNDLMTKLRWLATLGVPTVVQEYVPGPATNHYFVDGFMDAHGKVRACLSRKRLRMFPPDFGNSSAMTSVQPYEAEPAIRVLERLLTSIGYRGVYSAEFKRDERDGVFRLLEINARPRWYVEFAARCGVDVVMMAYRDALDLQVADTFDFDVGRQMVYPVYDAAAWEGLRAAGEADRADQVRSLLTSHWATFALDDPAPGMTNAAAIASRVIKRKLLGDPRASRREPTGALAPSPGAF